MCFCPEWAAFDGCSTDKVRNLRQIMHRPEHLLFLLVRISAAIPNSATPTKIRI
jgi:hypothetical protein